MALRGIRALTAVCHPGENHRRSLRLIWIWAMGSSLAEDMTGTVGGTMT